MNVLQTAHEGMKKGVRKMKNDVDFNWKMFILAGMAMFTISNSKSGKHITYQVKRPRTGNRLHVSVRGPYKNWLYIGTIGEAKAFKWSPNHSRVKPEDFRFKSFDWLWWHLRTNTDLPISVSIQHIGMCGRCGKKLTRPKSIRDGYGPECVKFIKTER
jgi:hypothetical protein